VLSLGLALPAGIGAGFAAEYFDPTIRTPHEADLLLEVPMLAWLPAERRAAAPVILQFLSPKDVLR
jgi:capsular polysaccharide biosynthesis protein